jgi:nucleotidyltransferase/DNA polymerase involved in DNA repair
MERVIFHMDGDAFFVGVEVAKDPKLKGLPVVTGEERGIVSALSYEAKALGVFRGMPIFQLKREFPNVIILPGDYKSYARYSSMMFDIVRRYADDVEEYSIDECFADLTGLNKPLKMTYLQMAERIKREVNEEMDLSVSIGLAPTKVLAKVASKWVKPNGLTVIDTVTAPKFLAETPVDKVWGIGPRTSTSLKIRGVETAGDFAGKDLAWVKQNFSKSYEAIWKELNGIQVMEVDPNPKTVYSSIQKTRTFHPATNDKTFLFSELSRHIEDACKKARYYKLAPKNISIFLKTQDFKYKMEKFPLASPTNAPEILISLAKKYFKSIHKKGVLYRTAGVTLHELISDSVSQGDLFGGRRLTDKFEAIHRQIDSLEDKFGRHAVYIASTHNAIKRKKIGTDAEDLDRDLLFL